MYTVYKDRDNTFAVQLVKNLLSLTAQQMQAITKVEVLYKTEYYDSATYASSFDWSTRESEGVVIFKLGIISTIPVGSDNKAELIIYTAADTNGVIWSLLPLKVIEES